MLIYSYIIDWFYYYIYKSYYFCCYMSLYCDIVAFKLCSTKAGAFGFGFGRQCWLIRLGLGCGGNGGGALQGEIDGYGAFCRVLAYLGVHAPADVVISICFMGVAGVAVSWFIVISSRTCLLSGSPPTLLGGRLLLRHLPF